MRVKEQLDQQTAKELRDKLRAKSQKRVWLTSGFIGCIDEPEDLSSNYKQYVAEAIDEKYPAQESKGSASSGGLS